MKPEEKLRELIRTSDVTTSPQTKQRILGDASERLNSAQKKTLSDYSEPNIWRNIMKRRTVRFATVTVVIGLVLCAYVFVSTPRSVVLAGVLEKVEQAQAYKYKMDITFTERTNPEKTMVQKIEGTITFSNEYGTKLETHEKRETDKNPDTGKVTTKIRYRLPKRRLDVLIKPDQKQYKWTKLDDDSIAEKKEQDDPREMIKQMLHCEYTKLGRSVIDGIEVEGFETTDPKWTVGTTEHFESVRVKLWVDAETWLPVLWDTETKINEQVSLDTVFRDFQWNIPVAASDFEPVIPPDYTSMDNYGLPRRFEEEALKGLRFSVELFGHYPEKIDQTSFISDPYFLNKENLTDAGLKLKEELESLDPEQRMEEAMVLSDRIQSIRVFYEMLVKTRSDPAYYGQTVGPKDTDKVLLRWKQDNGHYRVVFGDLGVRTITAEELAQLEKPSPR